MTPQTYNDIVSPELLKGVIENREFHGFLEDYHILHCLIRKYQPNSFFEIGTNFGTGTKIIKNAIGDGVVFTLDLPASMSHESLKGPSGKDLVGNNCNLPFVQLRGDSIKFDYSLYPCEGYFVDGEHDYNHPYLETKAIIKLNPKLIIWHDLHVVPVQHAIKDAFDGNEDYALFRVTDTRIAYALRK